MALKMKKKESGGGANWMDTYGDMVTLLLCFFVLLYSMSSISETSWRNLVMSFNPDAVQDLREVEEGNDSGPSTDPPSDGSVPMGEMEQADVTEALEQIYEAIQEYSQSNESGISVNAVKGDGYVYVTFDDDAFFVPNSYELLPGGEEALLMMAQSIEAAKDYIDEIRIEGHTAQGSATVPNTVFGDRMLSSERAAMACVRIQENCTLDPTRIITVGYGQWRPIASNEQAETRALNRRVEIMIAGFDLNSKLGDSLEQYELERSGQANLITDTSDTPVDTADTSGTDTGVATTTGEDSETSGAEGTES